ncbi:hypothetical protein [Amycolatopsis sp. CA-230715]|uniref:hypothetical protein n=1 Tax=Amycolatopsis sp. CA-230715 TaxID=2745196 RepID=UPI001C0252C1|nr:hypothetical protein [Amycolatopsis sp. CA-230715]QWF78877.1 hypothetical protein HUW46_02275 [Amycolatopsis sp. CA-230715]
MSISTASSPRFSTADLSPGAARACRLVTGFWLVMTTIQFVVWLLGCVIGMTFVAPFWLWSAVVGGALVAGLRWTVAFRRTRSAP